ncbi:MAG: hypothetical protein NTU98_14605 [Bacteroidetes bacterium]|nr:hypothetical protein [Bacteroidota bacterium]
MKTSAKNQTRCILPLLIIVLFCHGTLFPQQVIKFKSGKVYEVKLISQHADSIKYEMTSAPGIIFTTSMDQVEKIWNQKAKSTPAENQVNREYLTKKISHYNSLIVVGTVLGVVGVSTCLIGTTIKTKSNNSDDFLSSLEETNNKALKTAIIVTGGLISVAGLTLTIIGATKSSEYKDKLKGLSVDVKTTSSMAGISIRYRF